MVGSTQHFDVAYESTAGIYRSCRHDRTCDRADTAIIYLLEYFIIISVATLWPGQTVFRPPYLSWRKY